MRIYKGRRKEGRKEEKEVGGKEGCKKWRERKKLSSSCMPRPKLLGTIKTAPRIYPLELFPKNLALKQAAMVKYDTTCLEIEAAAVFR